MNDWGYTRPTSTDVCHQVNGLCRYCLRPRPKGYSVTCGRSECQEQAYHDTRERAALARRLRGRRR